MLMRIYEKGTLMKRKTRLAWRRFLSGWMSALFLLLALAGCQQPQPPNDGQSLPPQNDPKEDLTVNDPIQPTPEATKPLYVRTGNTTDFVMSGIDIDALLGKGIEDIGGIFRRTDNDGHRIDLLGIDDDLAALFEAGDVPRTF